ncbi:MAG TPA: hypothetical protein VGQ79_05765 [Nitrospiraceae bacterium]|nr:hypothetical protein [Nitrospiraceae bacterium]
MSDQLSSAIVMSPPGNMQRKAARFGFFAQYGFTRDRLEKGVFE